MNILNEEGQKIDSESMKIIKRAVLSIQIPDQLAFDGSKKFFNDAIVLSGGVSAKDFSD